MQPDNPNLKELVHNLRHDYLTTTLEKETARQNPFEQFELWLADAVEKQIYEPNAMVLSTATAGGKPSSRVVLLRGFGDSGFVFYTNYKSRKGLEIQENLNAALLFYWAEIERQVRVEGTIAKIKEKDSDAYFASRPRESRIGAWISPQSCVIENRDVLEKKFNELARQWEEKTITRPPDWGGYALKPEIFEFWQGRESRLHDRLLYTKVKSDWEIERLAP
jgi:pyridoxamine 5'-phosphate oxidase